MNEEHIKLNREYIGNTFSAGPFLVEPASIQQYAAATNETNPIYFHSLEDLISPPLYPVVFIPMVLSQLGEEAEEMGLDMLRVVHSQHSMTWTNLLRSGDEVHISAKIADMQLHGIHDTLDLEITISCEQEPVVKMQYQLLVRGKQKPGVTPKKKHEPDIELGQKLGEQSMIISEDQGLRYAKASGDNNPIHINEGIANMAGFPKTIVHGLCTMAFASKAIIEVLLDEKPSRLKYMSNRFSKPVFMGQTITTEIFEAGIKRGHRVVHYVTKNIDGIPVLTRGIAEYSE